MKLSNKSLYLQAKKAIREMFVQDKSLGFMSKLPSEQELSERFGVSRNTIREALKSLENEGLLTSRHGVGTFVLVHKNSIKHTITSLDSTTTIISNHGFQPGTQGVHFDCRTVQGEIAQRLEDQDELEVLYIERVRTADGDPVVYVEDYIPYRKEMLERYAEDSTQPLFPFMRSLGINISFASCEIRAVSSDERIQKKLLLSSPKALLLLRQMHYSHKGEPAFFSDSYYLTDKLEFGLIRRATE